MYLVKKNAKTMHNVVISKKILLKWERLLINWVLFIHIYIHSLASYE